MLFEDMEFGYYTEAERRVREALEHYENGKMPQALLALDTALELDPSNSSWHFNKGLTLDSVGRFEDAIKEYETALELSLNDLEVLNSLAVDYTRTGQYDLAIETFERIEQFKPDYEPCYCNRIITYTEMELHDLAEQMFYLAQQINPDCALCYYNIGNSLFIRGQYRKAIHCWTKTAELEPTHPQINYRIAQAYWSNDDAERAREHFLSELRANPGDIEVILDFGLFLLEKGDIESAKEKFTRIIELEPDFAPALFYLGEVAFNSGNYERALGLFEQTLEKDGELAGPRYRLAQYELAKQQHRRARDYLLDELKLAGNNADVLVSMGSMFMIIGEPDYAMHCLLRAVDIDDAHAQAYYYLGLISAMNDRLEDAADFLGHALDINPQDVNALKDSAIVNLAMGRLDKAAERLRKAGALAAGLPQLKALGRRIKLARLAERIANFFARPQSRFIRRLLSTFRMPARRG